MWFYFVVSPSCDLFLCIAFVRFIALDLLHAIFLNRRSFDGLRELRLTLAFVTKWAPLQNRLREITQCSGVGEYPFPVQGVLSHATAATSLVGVLRHEVVDFYVGVTLFELPMWY
jgi:hypothetical protein